MIATLALGLIVILAGSYLFTNAVEWTGKRLDLSEGVVGSLLAGVGTALPETIVPIIAIFFDTGAARQQVGIGAILGAPFMLSCLTIPMLGAGVLLLARLGRRDATMQVNAALSRTDLGYFVLAYAIALLLTLAPPSAIGTAARFAAAALLVVLYLSYLRKLLRHEGGIEGTVGPLLFARRRPSPGLPVILIQLVIGLGVIVGGAHLFVDGIAALSQALSASPLVISLLITPIATELPEKFNSLIWISQRKDRLAIGNITGAMVFQGTFPVAVGLTGTPWQLDPFGLLSALFALTAAAWLYLLLRWNGGWRPVALGATFGLYLIYGAYVIVQS